MEGVEDMKAIFRVLSVASKVRFTWLRALCLLLGIAHLIGSDCVTLEAQSYLTSTGSPSFAAPYPAEMGTVDAASGNLHLEIPLGSFSQRRAGALVPKFVYDSHIWTVPTDGASKVWTLTGTLYGLAFGTWGFYEGGSEGVYNMATSGSGCKC